MMNVGLHDRSGYIMRMIRHVNDPLPLASALRFVPAGSYTAERPRRRTQVLRVRRQNLSSSELDVESECSQFSLGPSLISAEALFEPRDLLTSLPYSRRLR